MQTKSIFSVLILIGLAVLLPVTFVFIESSAVAGRGQWMWQTMLVGFGAVIFVLASAWERFHRLRRANDPARWWAAVVLVSAAVTIFRLLMLYNPATQAAVIKRGYIENVGNRLTVGCNACAYEPHFDLFDADLFPFFRQDTAFVAQYAANCRLDQPQWQDEGIEQDIQYHPYYSEQYMAFGCRTYLLWRLQGYESAAEILALPNGDAVLLATALASVRNYYISTLRSNFEIEAPVYRMHPDVSRLLAELEGNIIPRFGWLSESDYKALYQHFANKDTRIPNQVLNLLEHIGKGLYWPSELYAWEDYQTLLQIPR